MRTQEMVDNTLGDRQNMPGHYVETDVWKMILGNDHFSICTQKKKATAMVAFNHFLGGGDRNRTDE